MKTKNHKVLLGKTLGLVLGISLFSSPSKLYAENNTRTNVLTCYNSIQENQISTNSNGVIVRNYRFDQVSDDLVKMRAVDLDGDGLTNEFYRVNSQGKKEGFIEYKGVYADLTLAEKLDTDYIERASKKYLSEAERKRFCDIKYAESKLKYKILRSRLESLNN